ncbi:hypothetical protein DOTSEDRAFT_28255 [Dothistroma septosporum NZE10]|uniref:Uncharacterized protein n=1 Tax=Dothistroma septosporum (strain NZE10 / CBS 128990) TaxID=675120 RepID=N1PFK5_DOTSN|nr:hypothetical protein DOTSEDRAFT_28255 [Dothistroma septosporum NZE10]
MAPFNFNDSTVVPVRVTDEELQEGRHRVQTRERFEPLSASASPPPTSPLSSPPSTAPVKNNTEATTARSAILPLPSYLNATTPASNLLLLLDWKDLTKDALLTVAAEYTTDEVLEEVNRLRTATQPLPPPITKRQAHQKITSSLNSVAKRNEIRRRDLKAALQEARRASGCLARMNGTSCAKGGEDDEEKLGVSPREGVSMLGKVKKFRVVIDRMPAKKWEKKTVGMRSITGGRWKMESWGRS